MWQLPKGKQDLTPSRMQYTDFVNELFETLDTLCASFGAAL